jgi:DinB superfamily
MTTRMEYAQQPVVRCLERMERTVHEVAAAIDGQGDATLSRRPAPTSWSAKEVVCHLRDIEELFLLRFRSMLALDEPTFLVLGEMPPDQTGWGLIEGDALPLDPDRWAEERQYLRNDTGQAVAALRRRRQETLALLGRLGAEQWRRGSIHVTLGRMTFADWVALIAAHDDKHLAQLRRALQGHP